MNAVHVSVDLNVPARALGRGLLRLAHHLPLIAALAVIAACGASAAESAPTGVIAGRVQNEVTGAALEHARVSVPGTSLSTATDSAGFYSLTVPSGSVTLRFSFTGLDAKEVTAQVTAGQRSDLDIQLTSVSRYGADETIKLSQVVVESKRETDAATIAVNEQRFASNIVSVVSTDEFGTVVDRNPGEFLKMLPGVDVEYFANNITGVNVRGLGSANTEINFDGMPTASANAESVGRSFEIQYSSAADIARVEVRKLPLPEDSANAVGGSINLIRRSAFEYSKRKISYRALFQSDGEEFTLKDYQGPKDRLRARWRPNWEVSWTEPISRKIGFAVTLGQNDVLVNTHWSQPGWNIGSTSTTLVNPHPAGAARRAAGETWSPNESIYYPAMGNPLNHNAPKMQGKNYASARFDWRVTPELTFGYSAGYTYGWVQNADDIRYRWNGAATEWSGETGYPGRARASRWVGVGTVGNTPNGQVIPGVTGNRYDSYTSVGRLGGGAAQNENPLWRDVETPTLQNVIDTRWHRGPWTLAAKGAYSKSSYRYYDTEHGFFKTTSVDNVDGLINIPHTGIGASSGNPVPITMVFSGLDNYWAPTSIKAYAATDFTVPGSGGKTYKAGQEVEWWKNENMSIGGAQSRPGDSVAIVTAMKLLAKRDFSFRNPLSVQLGLDWQEIYRDRRYLYKAWRFVGADGVPGTADDLATQIAADHLTARRDSVYDYPAIERVSMQKLYSLYKAHPEYFAYDEERSARLSLTNAAAYDLTERTMAPYVQLDQRFMQGRLRFTGGVRYEKSTAKAHGLLTNNSAAYLHYADGSVVHVNDRDAAGNLMVVNRSSTSSVAQYEWNNATNTVPTGLPTTRAGSPVFIPSIQAAGNALRAAGRTTDTGTNLGRGTLLHTATVYREKGAYAEGSNDNYFPSLHGSFNITENLILQAGYARTQARNRFDRSVIPNNEIVETIQSNGAIGVINVRNTELQPWVADNYEARLSYYTRNGGSIALGAFRKNIQHYQISDTSEPLTPEDIAAGKVRWEDGTATAIDPQWGIDASSTNYSINTYYNSGSARIEGTELEFRQNLDLLLGRWRWARGFSIHGTSSYTNLKGRPGGGDLSGIRDFRHTAGLNYSNRRFSVNVNYTINGRQVESIQTTSPVTADSTDRYSWERVYLPEEMLDISVDVRLNRWARLFFGGRNITNEVRQREDQRKLSPAYTQLQSSNSFGVTYTVGITGTF